MVELNYNEKMQSSLVPMSKCNLFVVFSAIHDGSIPHGLNHTTRKNICVLGRNANDCTY